MSVHSTSVQNPYIDSTDHSSTTISTDPSGTWTFSEASDEENLKNPKNPQNPQYPKFSNPTETKEKQVQITSDVSILSPPVRTDPCTDIRTDRDTDHRTDRNCTDSRTDPKTGFVRESSPWSIGEGKGEEEKWRALKGYEKWNIDLKNLYLGRKIASGTYGRVYLGMYGNRDVAAKILRGGEEIEEEEREKMEKQFKQEVAISWELPRNLLSS